MSASGLNRAARRGWDQRVREARAKYTEIPMPDGEPIRVLVPDSEALDEFYALQYKGKLHEAMGILMGAENVARLQDSAKVLAGEDGRIPITVWKDLLDDVLVDLGMKSPE